MRLILVRHAATDWSVIGRHTGRSNIPLSFAGREQTQTMLGLFKFLIADAPETVRVISSPLERAMETAMIVVDGQYDIATSPDLLEMNYGDYEGLTPAEIRGKNPNWDIWSDGCPGGESIDDVGRRADNFLASVNDDDTTVVFAHGHIVRVLAARAINLPAHSGQIFTLDAGAFSVIGDVRGKRVVMYWNLTTGIAEFL
jgi:probable phosphoglycerate mutase